MLNYTAKRKERITLLNSMRSAYLIPLPSLCTSKPNKPSSSISQACNAMIIPTTSIYISTIKNFSLFSILLAVEKFVQRIRTTVFYHLKFYKRGSILCLNLKRRKDEHGQQTNSCSQETSSNC